MNDDMARVGEVLHVHRRRGPKCIRDILRRVEPNGERRQRGSGNNLVAQSGGHNHAPERGREEGWDAVDASLERVAKLSSVGAVGLKDQFIRVVGDLAYELGVEHGHLTLAGHHVTFEHRVTNLYERQARAWKVVHHHADTSPALIDVISRLNK